MRPAYLLCFFALFVCAQRDDLPPFTRAVTDPGVVTTRQAITPAGVQSVFNGRVYGAAFGQDSSDLYVLNASAIYRLDPLTNASRGTVTLGGTPGLQALRYDDRFKRILFAENPRGGTGVQLVASAGEKRQVLAQGLGSNLAGSIAVSTGGQPIAAVPLTANNRVALIDADSGRTLANVDTGIAPFGAVLSRDGSAAWVSNWGGRKARPGELTAPTGSAPKADQVVVDKRGIAATGTVTRIDVAKGTATHTVAVGLHPTALALDEQRQRLYVANSNSDSISVIDTAANRVVYTIQLQPFGEKTPGVAPTALVLSADGKRLFAACGGINAVAVLDAAGRRVEGLIPTSWYPNALALSPDGRKLAVTALLGVGSGSRETPKQRFVHSYRGTVHVLDIPDAAQLASYSTAVAENNRIQLAGSGARPPIALAPRSQAPARAIPQRAGEASLIEHVVFIIKENRTYDQVLGALPQGNGDRSLVMFGRDVTPNQHKLAEEFVVLDNFYATGGNSADGHQWITQATETSYCLWPGYIGRSYPYDGSDPIAYASSGFLWDYALARRKTVRVYGEYVPAMRVPVNRHAMLKRWSEGGTSFSKEWSVKSPIPSLDGVIARQFPSYNLGVPDVVRASIFLEEFRDMEKRGTMPNLTMIQLPSDHTEGARAGSSTAKAMVADNDYALGQIVEALSQSRFWPKMAIFVIEDDAQNGVDHVDGHRTVALAISPYVKRRHVDSTFYSTQSMVKTIELILGLPTMSLFDLIASDMRLSFTDVPDLQPFQAERPEQSLFERNPPVKALRGKAREAALASARMRFGVPDAAPTGRLNRILWGQVRGWNTPYPGTRAAVFTPMGIEVEDDER